MPFDLNYALKFLCKIMKYDCTKRPSEGKHPFGKVMSDCLDCTLDELKKLGFETKNLDNYCGYAQIGAGEAFDILGHLDTVPAGKGWTHPPFGANIVDGVLYGRGALDNKGPMVAVIYAIAKILEEGLRPTKKLRLIFGLDEESGWSCMEHFKKHEKFADKGFSPDGDFPVINAEKGMFHYVLKTKRPKQLLEINGGTRANIVPNYCSAKFIENGEEKNLSCTGIASHASHPELGENAIVKLLKSLPNEFVDLKKIGELFEAIDGSNAKLKLCDIESGSLTLNLGTVKIENDEIVFNLDIRCPVTISRDTITNILKSYEEFDVEPELFHDPLYLPKDAPIIQALLGAYRKVTGDYSEPIAVGGGTYARLLKNGCAFGPAFPNKPCPIHQADECVSIEDFEKMSQIYYHAIKDICFS